MLEHSMADETGLAHRLGSSALAASSRNAYVEQGIHICPISVRRHQRHQSSLWTRGTEGQARLSTVQFQNKSIFVVGSKEDWRYDNNPYQPHSSISFGPQEVDISSWRSELVGLVLGLIDAPVLETPVYIPEEISLELDQFKEGIDEGLRPSELVVEMAVRICQKAIRVTDYPDIIVDDAGALSFDFRLRSGILIMAEIEIDGSMYISLHDEQDKLLERFPNATEENFLKALQS